MLALARLVESACSYPLTNQQRLGDTRRLCGGLVGPSGAYSPASLALADGETQNILK
jgi:hypothetical protein